MRLHPHLSFNGQCEAALKFYEECLNGKITFLMTYGESPMAEQVPADWRRKIIHATLTWRDQVVSGADAWGEHYQKPQGFSVVVDLEDVAESERIFAALAVKAKVQMPIQETFWAERFGLLVDQFHIPWMINCGKTP